MWEWLLTPIDGTRVHDLGAAISWHGRLMVIAWGVCVPLGVIVARFFKVLPGQKFPEVVDVRVWWHTHLIAQFTAMGLTAAGLWLVLQRAPGLGSLTATDWLHRGFGWSIVWLAVMQGVSGLLRGTRGGPGESSLRGDHYDMTPRRLAFETLHKTAGYVALILSMAAVLTGMWQANAPHWMWIALPTWWATMAALFVLFERRGMVIDTYVAIWGPDAAHPGNARRRPPDHD